MEKIFKKIKHLLVISTLSFIVFNVLPVTAQAASLYFSPSTGSYNINQTFQVGVFVSSAVQPVNAYASVISFNQQNIEVVSISQIGSIVNFWAQQPSFSNVIGQINFEGVTFDPGFKGAGGRIITITFRAKAAGTVTSKFIESAVFAHDGKGTNILKSISSAQYDVGVAKIPAPEIVSKPEPELKLEPELESEQFDIEPPEPFEVVVEDSKFIFETTDKDSGIDRYEIILNEKLYDTVLPEDVPPYRHAPLSPGKYSLEIKAFDKADNFISAFTNFEILAIGDVIITKAPLKLREKEVLRIEGETLPELLVKIYIQRKGEEPIIIETKSDLDGNFVLQYDKSLAQGDYFIWVQAENEKGELTNLTEKHSLYVGLPPFLKLGKIVLDYFTTIITLFILIIGILLVIFYSWHRIVLWRKKLRIETKEVSQSVLSAFRALRDEVEEQIEYLDGKPGLNKNEKKVRDKLKEALNISEKFIDKEIKDIEKELK